MGFFVQQSTATRALLFAPRMATWTRPDAEALTIPELGNGRSGRDSP
jgi:hypothetical protein